MKKYLWFGLWLCLIATSSLAVETTATENISESTEIEGNYLVSKVSKTHKILEIPSDVKTDFSDKTIMTVYETGESVTVKDGRQEIYSLFTYHYVQPEKTLAFIDGNFYLTKQKIMGQSVGQFLWTVVLPIFLTIVSTLLSTTVPFKSLAFLLSGLILSVDISLFIFSLLIILGCTLFIFHLLIKIDENNWFKAIKFFFSSLIFVMVAPFTIGGAVRVSDLYVLPSLMLEFAILSLILFILEMTVYQWSNRSRNEEIPIKIPFRDKVL